METKLPGVTIAKKKNQTIYYRASVTHKRKHISLGSFSAMPAAHKAYQEALQVLHTVSLSISDYSNSMLLSFDKWVSLINYRDNGLYFSNPIYTHKKFFNYYLSTSSELIFDIDDLFYYSSHKIMQRGSHLFVADYGMQVTLLNRYGVRSYSVLDRDYRFINGDCHDFRYENIEVINRYQGVTQVVKKGQLTYKAKIHIRSSYLIGYYSSEEKAAIAYNKAIDILLKQGFSKNYVPNFVEDLSNIDYADIYTKIKVSASLYTLTPQ